MTLQVFIGHEPRLPLASQVCLRSLLEHASCSVDPRFLHRGMLGASYARPIRLDPQARTWDVISNAPMSTAFSLARFWVPELATEQWALFVDGDFLFRGDVAELFQQANSRYAIQVVRQHHVAAEEVKMDGQVQTQYERKNESSCMLWNLHHPANRALRWDDLNRRPGLWLHQFGWLAENNIGELTPEWNVLDGMVKSTPAPTAGCHFTRGTPDIHPEGRNLLHADEWLSYLTRDERKQVEAGWLRRNLMEKPCKPADSATA